MLDPVRLRSLVALHATGTVTAAAASLGYSASAVSQHLAGLARDVGVELVRPVGRNVVLTAAGEALVAAADDVFDAHERARVAARAAATVGSGPIRVGALGTTIIDLLPAAVASLREARPATTLTVVDLGDDVLGGLRRRRVEVALDHRWSNVPTPDLAGLEVVPLCREPVVVIAREDLDLTDPATRRRAAWVGHPCEQCGPASLRIITERLGDPDPQLPITTGDMTVMLHVAALGAAMVVLPALACLHLPAGVRAWRVPDVDREIIAATRPATAVDPDVAAVVDHLVAAGATVEARFADIGAVDLGPSLAPVG